MGGGTQTEPPKAGPGEKGKWLTRWEWGGGKDGPRAAQNGARRLSNTWIQNEKVDQLTGREGRRRDPEPPKAGQCYKRKMTDRLSGGRGGDTEPKAGQGNKMKKKRRKKCKG